MNNTPDRIKSILTEQINGYRTLLEVLQREREYLVHLNPEGVETLAKEKDTIMLKLRLLEDERLRLVRAFAKETGVKGELTLKRLHEVTGDAAFSKLRSQMVSLVQAISEFNEFNKILIERSANFVRRTLGFLDSFGLSSARKKTGSVISREV
jgi:flagellar biosynthesis/type III secretory pathway chaperone